MQDPAAQRLPVHPRGRVNRNMQATRPRRIALLSFAYCAVLVLQVGSRLLSGRDQDTVEAVYAAIADQAAWHALYALSVTTTALLLVAVITSWSRWHATRHALLGWIAHWLSLAAGTCWLVGGLAAMLQTAAGPTVLAGDLAPLTPAGLEETRAISSKLGMSLAGAAILMVGARTRLADLAGSIVVLAAVLSGLAALGIWLEELPFHRLLGVLYLGWFVVGGLWHPLRRGGMAPRD